jgi:hypothetical protein
MTLAPEPVQSDTRNKVVLFLAFLKSPMVMIVEGSSNALGKVVAQDRRSRGQVLVNASEEPPEFSHRIAKKSGPGSPARSCERGLLALFVFEVREALENERVRLIG